MRGREIENARRKLEAEALAACRREAEQRSDRHSDDVCSATATNAMDVRWSSNPNAFLFRLIERRDWKWSFSDNTRIKNPADSFYESVGSGADRQVSPPTPRSHFDGNLAKKGSTVATFRVGFRYWIRSSGLSLYYF